MLPEMLTWFTRSVIIFILLLLLIFIKFILKQQAAWEHVFKQTWCTISLKILAGTTRTGLIFPLLFNSFENFALSFTPEVSDFEHYGQCVSIKALMWDWFWSQREANTSKYSSREEPFIRKSLAFLLRLVTKQMSGMCVDFCVMWTCVCADRWCYPQTTSENQRMPLHICIRKLYG